MVRKPNKHEQELIADLQRVRADFENYRKRIETEKHSLAELTKATTVMKLLPVIDNIERAVAHAPKNMAEDKWVQGVVAMAKGLEKSLSDLGLAKIDAKPGTQFSPDRHEAVMIDDGEGENEVIAEVLRPGYMLNNQVIRPSMVRVKRA